ncbi:LysM peptidoglycan-binding domain-containing protein [Streptomyces sp. NPDC002588]|uniref:CIS tube protein n=1 Tax=Streptomyces sp. NPDC002588 TaxID=3154419 RepID=UPI0033230EB1
MTATATTGTAYLTELVPGTSTPVEGGVDLRVDFDPANLRLTYTPTGVVGAEAVTTSGTLSKAAAQQTGQSTTLSVELTFDTTAENTTVQEKTNQIVKLTQPDRERPGKPVRRGARFSWGSFVFDGAVQSLTQNIDFFSDAGVPLRATIQLTMCQVAPAGPDTVRPAAPEPAGFGAGAGAAAPSAAADTASPVGTTPLTLSRSGDSVQSIAARSGVGVSWKTVAAANGIDNPRLLPPGTVLDLTLRTP